MIKKLEKVLIATSIGSLTLLPLLITNKDQIYLSLKNITKNIDENIYPIAKVDPMYEVKTLRKVRSDADAINVIFFGDNYAKNADKNLFADFSYTNIVKPWLSTTYPAVYPGDDKLTFLTSGTKVPFQTFLNDKINAYSVQPNFKENSSLSNSTDTFFGIYTSSNTSLLVSAAGRIKLNVLTYDITNNFLEENAIVTPSYSGLIRNGTSGRANAEKHYTATTQDPTDVHIHEMGHSIWGLSDEYNDGYISMISQQGVNRFESANPTEQNIPWKEFLNFRGIGIVKIPGQVVVPSSSCSMAETKVPGQDFCEVCIHQIIKRGVEITQNELFYIADPQLTPSEGRPSYNDPLYSAQRLEYLELYENNITWANNKHLDFRTVVDNMTTKPRNVKLKVTIKGNNGFSEESEVFKIQPGEIKQLKLITEKTATNLDKNVNTIIGEVIDTDTNEVLATSRDRYNAFWPKQPGMESGYDFGKKLYTVTINFLNNETNQPLPNIQPSILIKRAGEKFELQKILFNGYRLDETKSKINSSHQINGSNLKFDYYYNPLPFKSLKLKLLNENNEQIQEKIVKVYEGQEFIPKSSDFFLYDLEKFVGSNNENSNWVKSVIAPEKTYLYDQIENNKTELVYRVSQEKPTYMVAKDIKLVQGEDFAKFLRSKLFKNYLTNIYNSDFSFYDYDPAIIYNSVDTSTPGKYLVVFYFKNNMNIQDSNHSLLRLNVIVEPNNQDPSFTPNKLEAEKNRLESYRYIWINQLEEEKGLMSDFESINQSNLLSNIDNFNLNNNRFNYEVLEFNKLYPGIGGEQLLGYQFKIKISDKETQQFVTTNDFTKYVWLRNGESTTPPTAEVEMQNEINRINSLSLSLKNPILTQEEVNNINQNNILQNINGWVEGTGFFYEIINFSNSNNQFKFSIKVTKNSLNQNSKEFVLSYQIKSEQTEQELLQQEINRINNLTLSLANNTFSQQEIDQINNSNFVNNLSNWNLVTLNSSKYNYEITGFNNSNNKFTFNIKVTLISNPSISQTSNQFSLDYQITTSVNQDLINEKNRIDRLDLSFNKQEFSPDEIKGILDGTISITEYLNNWSGNNDQFNYQFIVNRLSDNELSLTIQIKDKNNTSEYRNSKSFVLRYEPSNSSNNLTTVILASTLAPAGAIAAGVAGTIIYKKKKRKY